MTYRCIPVPAHQRIVLMGPDNEPVHVYEARYPAHMGTCRRFARMKNQESRDGR